MPTPDVTPLVDLTVNDLDTQTLIERAINDATAKLPEWEPAEYHTETVLLETMALEVTELIYAINRVPGAVLEVALRLFGLTRDPGAPAVASVTFTASDTTGQTIPAGARLLAELPDAEPLELTTDRDLVIAPGSLTGDVTATAQGAPRADANGTPAGTALVVVESLAYVDSATLATPIVGGREPEDGDAFLERATVRLQRLASTLVLPSHFTAAALEDPAVSRAVTIDNYDPTQGGAPGSHPGHVTVAVTGLGGDPLPDPTKLTLKGALEAQALAILNVHVADATISNLDVAVTVTVTGAAAALTVPDDTAAAIRAYLNPDAWPFAGTVYRNELIALVDRVPGVDRVVDVTVPAGDVALTGVAPLVRAGTVTVTIV